MGKEKNVREWKYWNSASVIIVLFEDNTMHCKQVNNGGGGRWRKSKWQAVLIWSKHDICTCHTDQGECPLSSQHTLKERGIGK
jgi:hypothetical protein